ncbi:MAG: hypothetical protein O9289_00110 [Rhodobacteraceae bacterium]|nr:hypothetical protein [Paracoccaceae bacterium]MCZ8081573.1 hypothetical protein [Paracoccaceae bacterium]
MEIQTKHRKSAEQNRPKGRALFALAERKEAPFAAMLAALTLAMAGYVKSAFGNTPLSEDLTALPSDRTSVQDAAVSRKSEMEMANPLLAFDDPEEQPIVIGKLEDDVDLGRIGRGPGMLDLSRFFPETVPSLDIPNSSFADQPDSNTPSMKPLLDDGVDPLTGTPNLGGGGQAGGGAGTKGPSGPGAEEGADAIAGVNFDALFAQLAAVVRPFHPTTVREISDLAIGDWVSQHELYRLRGGETLPDMDVAYLAREDRTFDTVTNPDSREAFIDQFFPASTASDPAMPEATLSEAMTAAAMQPEPLLSTDTNTSLL